MIQTSTVIFKSTYWGRNLLRYFNLS